MSKLFLASSLDIVINKFKEKVSGARRVLFVEDAAVPYAQQMELFWVENDYQAFAENGFEVTRFTMLKCQFKNSPEKITSFLKQFDIIHFNGGHTKYLLASLHETGFFQPVKQAVINEELIYTGTSAGSMIVAPTLAEAGRLDDDLPAEFSQILKPEYLTGLNLVSFLILPHFNNPEMIPTNYETIQSVNYPHPLIFLNDEQAIWVEDKRFEIVEKNEESIN